MLEKELLQFLQKQEEKTVLLDLQGIIATKILIEQMQMKKEKNRLILENKQNNKWSIGFNLHQLMKITKVQKDEVLLEFDQLQNVMIKAITLKSNSF